MAGLSKDPRPIVGHVHELYKEMHVGDLRYGNMDRDRLKMLKDNGKDIYEPHLFVLLYAESKVPLPGSWNHNEHRNKYGVTDDVYKMFKGRAPVYFPSRLYLFSDIAEDVIGDIEQHEGTTEIPECAMLFTFGKPHVSVVMKVLSLCRQISEWQRVTDWCLANVQCDTLTKAEAAILCKNVQSVKFLYCDVPRCFVRSILHQLFDSATLQCITFKHTNVREYEDDLDELMENLSSRCLKEGLSVTLSVTESMVSETFWLKWYSRSGEGGILLLSEPKPISASVINQSEVVRLLAEQKNQQSDCGETSNGQVYHLDNNDDNCSNAVEGRNCNRCVIL